jgi:ATP-binding cassette subfamily B multidrug efflux pump
MGKNLKPLWPYLSKYRLTLFWGAITVLFNNGLWVLSPQVVRRAVDDLNHHGITQRKMAGDRCLTRDRVRSAQ